MRCVTRNKKMVDLGDYLPWGHLLPQWFLEPGERFLGFHALNKAHARIDQDWEAGSKEDFFKLACRYLHLDYDVTGLEHIPTEGPCVIVSNHPHGMSDGLMFGDLVMRVRSDIRIVVNEWLSCVRGMRPYEITVDVYGGEQAKRANMAGMRAMLQWLRQGHCLLVFPSGSAASYSSQDQAIIDDPWQVNIASVIRKTGASVVPMHISGHTGKLFQFVTRVAKPHRSCLLAREIKRDGKMRHRIQLGELLTPSILEMLPDDQSLSDYLRLRSMLLRYPKENSPAGATLSPREMPPIADPIPADTLQAEIDALPPECLCYTNEVNGLRVYATLADQIPQMLQEIGIQREITFRQVGEGAGTACDLDAYDSTYVHLIMWDAGRKRLAGAYRMGRTDLIMEHQGVQGIYNAAFFDFSQELLATLSRGVEMGRAFITRDYQRLPASLDTLWMGIGRYLNRHPEYRYLYGTVSISKSFCNLTRSLIHSYLKTTQMNATWAAGVRAHTPPTQMNLRSEDERLLPSALPDIRLLSGLVTELEGDGKTLPILLKQYLRLGGKMISFNLDHDFGDTLDCLVVVDLQHAPDRVVHRYRGKDYISPSLS